MNSKTWDQVRDEILANGLAPKWTSNLFASPYDALSSGKTSHVAEVSFTSEKKLVAKSYLQFLCEQISLNARGEEWTNILKKRHAALKPYIGKNLISMWLSSKEGHMSIWIDPLTVKIVHIENE